MPIINPVFSPVFRMPITNTNWNPKSLFTTGTIGYWYDPSDITTLFQDNLGVTPVTASGQTVGRILDKSGNGNHATQATLAQRPTYIVNANGFSYLSFDGVDDNLVIPSLSLVGTEDLFLCFGAQRLSSTNFTALMNFGLGGAGNPYNGFRFGVEGSSVPAYSLRLVSSNASGGGGINGSSPNSFGNAATRVASGTRRTLRINSARIATSGTFVNFSGFASQQNRLGCYYAFANQQFWKGGIYQSIFAAIDPSNDQISSSEDWCNLKTGAY